ncbi:MAG: DUF3995 domain-containing protein [Bacteroidota bacterium]
MAFTKFFALSLCFIFLILSIIHIYWALGGQWGIDKALPMNEGGEKTMNPSFLATIIVAIGLAVFSMFYLLETGWSGILLPNWLLSLASWSIPSIFLLRALGDFKYAGFFKKITHTDFAKWDTRLYTPLCLFIGSLGIIIALVG